MMRSFGSSSRRGTWRSIGDVMKILLVILHANSARGGSEAYTVTLFQKLREAGHDVKLAAATFEMSIPQEHRVTLAHTGLTRVGRYRRFIRSLQQHRAAQAYDIVHAMLPVPCDVYHPHAGLEVTGWNVTAPFQKLTNQRRAAFVNMERALLTGDAKISWHGHLACVPSRQDTGAAPVPHHLPTVLCLSDRAKREAASEFPKGLHRMETLYSAVDDRCFVPESPAETNPTLCLFIGQDFHRKGLDIAMRAIEARPKLKLRIIGNDDSKWFRWLRVDLGLLDRCTFAGASNNVAGELSRAAVLLLPARREPFGMVVSEAMLMGVPPIVSANAGASEIVRDGVDGRIVNDLDPANWAAAIDDVLANRDRYSASCLSRRGELAYSHSLSQLIGIYERVCRERTS